MFAPFFSASYLVMLVLCAPFLRQAWLPGAGADAYALVLALAQAAFYLLPAFALTQLARWALLWRQIGRDTSELQSR